MERRPFEVRPAVTGETIFRVIDEEEPRQRHFFADEQAGALLNPSLEGVAAYRGFSARATLAQAQALARLFEKHRQLKHYVAELVLDSEEGDDIARTGTRGHHTVWAEASSLVHRVHRVHDV